MLILVLKFSCKMFAFQIYPLVNTFKGGGSKAYGLQAFAFGVGGLLFNFSLGWVHLVS